MEKLVEKKERVKKTYQEWDGNVATSFAGGNGTSAMPYLVESEQQFANMKFRLSKDIKTNEEYYYHSVKEMAEDTGMTESCINGSIYSLHLANSMFMVEKRYFNSKDICKNKEEFFKRHNLDLNKKLIGIFPGSRIFEIKYLLNIFVHAIKLIEKIKPDTQFVFSHALSLKDDAFNVPYKKIKGDMFK